jgi:hypothetical protein
LDVVVHNNAPYVFDDVDDEEQMLFLDKKIQIIFVRSLPHFRQGWSQYIVGGFDIDVCKCSILFDESGGMGNVIVSKEVSRSIMSGEFNYEVRPGTSFQSHVKRIMKYIKKGFKLTSITYHRACSEEFKCYINNRLQHLFFSPTWCKESAVKMGMDDRMVEAVLRMFLVPNFDVSSPLRDKLQWLDIVERNAIEILSKVVWTKRFNLYICKMRVKHRIRPWRWYVAAIGVVRWYKRCLINRRMNVAVKGIQLWYRERRMKRKRTDECGFIGSS